MSETCEKVYCLGDMSGRNSVADMAALMNGGNGCQWNNPFFYLIFLMMFRNGGFGNGFGGDVNGDLNRISAQISTGNNTELLMDSIKGNHAAMHELATNLNCDFNNLSTAICGVKSAIERVGGEVGITSERVINSVLMGNKDLTAAIQNCCCTTQQNILKMGYDNQIGTLNQTTQLQERLTGIANGIQQGFSATAYETQKQTCEIINNQNANTQAIKDLLNAHWQSDLAGRYADAKLELSQQRQNAYLIEQLRTATATAPTT